MSERHQYKFKCVGETDSVGKVRQNGRINCIISRRWTNLNSLKT